MKNLLSLVFLCFWTTTLLGQGIVIQNGATFSINGEANIVINNADLSNSGDFVAGNSHLIFRGNQSSSISGNSKTTCYQLSIDKSGTAHIDLLSDIQIDQNLNLVGGMLDINDQKLTLGSDFGQIVGENEVNRITANTGTIAKTLAINAPTTLNPGNIGAELTSSQNLGNTTIIRGHEKVSNFIGETIQRYYIITPTNNTGLNATLRLYYLDAEYTILNENNFIMTRSTDGGMNWQEITSTANNTVENWLEKDNLDGFSSWTIGLPSIALSGFINFFEVNKDQNTVVCTWAMTDLNQVDYFEVERTIDGN